MAVDFFKIARSILVQFVPILLFSWSFVSVHVVHPYSSMDTATGWKNPVLFYRIDQTPI